MRNCNYIMSLWVINLSFHGGYNCGCFLEKLTKGLFLTATLASLMFLYTLVLS